MFLLGSWLIVKRRMHSPVEPVVAGAPRVAPPPAPVATGPTVVDVSSVVIRQRVKRLGMNLGGENFYDSQQILKNLVSRNPGFEGQQWQTVMRCDQVSPTSCTDAGHSGNWPQGFLDQGSYEIISGAGQGQTGTISHSTLASEHVGVTITFAQPAKLLAANDTIKVRSVKPGNATAGWSPQANGGATITTEFTDLSPRTTGTQAVRLNASGAGQEASLNQYFDSIPGRSYLQFRGAYVIRFRAKAVAGRKAVSVYLQRPTMGPWTPLFKQNVLLTSDWKDYTLQFHAAEAASNVGTLMFGFTVSEAEVLLDDVSLTEAGSNGTAFRNDVVATLQRLNPGVLRYMDSGNNFGSDLDNMLAPEEARQRSGFNKYLSESDDIPVGLHDFLVLCEKIGAEPWYTMQIGMSEKEAAGIMQYLGGSTATKYGATRAALGHPLPWTQTFPVIHLEYGNEAWNEAQPGASIPDPEVYAARASTIFRIMRASPEYAAGRFDLIADGQAVNTFMTAKILEKIEGADTIDIAPYFFHTFNDDSSLEHIFGPMFAQPQMLDSAPEGYVHKQANAAATALHPVRLAVYETNIDAVTGTVGQASVNATVPSLGAGIAAVDHMLLMLRDLGVTVQNTFTLTGGGYHFTNTAGRDPGETSPVWSVVVDMGGATNRVRPSFLAQMLANQAIGKQMLATRINGSDPTWDQPRSPNDNVELERARELQSFAFTSPQTSTLIVFNLSRSGAHSIGLSGDCAPQGAVTVKTLTATAMTDNNEQSDKVKVVSREEQVTPGSSTFSLPPFSMTTLSSKRPDGCKIDQPAD